MKIIRLRHEGVSRKFSRGGGRKKDQKLAKKIPKIALFASSRRGQRKKKDQKNRKKGRKIAKKSQKQHF